MPSPRSAAFTGDARSTTALNPLRASSASLRPYRVTAAADRAGSPCRTSRKADPLSQFQECGIGEPLVAEHRRRLPPRRQRSTAIRNQGQPTSTSSITGRGARRSRPVPTPRTSRSNTQDPAAATEDTTEQTVESPGRPVDWEHEQPWPTRDLFGGLITTVETLIHSRDYTDSAAPDGDRIPVTESQPQSHRPSHLQSHSIRHIPLISLAKPEHHDPSTGPGKGSGERRERPGENPWFSPPTGVPPSHLRARSLRVDLSILEGCDGAPNARLGVPCGGPNRQASRHQRRRCHRFVTARRTHRPHRWPSLRGSVNSIRSAVRTRRGRRRCIAMPSQ